MDILQKQASGQPHLNSCRVHWPSRSAHGNYNKAGANHSKAGVLVQAAVSATLEAEAGGSQSEGNLGNLRHGLKT